MLANREGLFNAYPVDIGLGETNQNKLLQVVIKYRLVEELANGEWTDCSAEGMEISGFHVLEKKDHTLNTGTIDSLKAALGWDGRDPFWLQDSAEALTQQPVQVRLQLEEYGGQKSLKVAFLNPYGSKGGGVPKADDSLRRNVANRLGSKFRANAGGTPAPAPKPTGKPAAPAPKPAAPKPAAPAAKPEVAKAEPAPECSMQDAWAAYCEAYEKLGPRGSEEDREQQWFTIVDQQFPHRRPEDLNPQEWGALRAQGFTGIVPF